MVKEPEDAFASEQEKGPASYIGSTINSNANQESIIVEDADVRPNDHKVLDTLSENNSSYTFRGLMRKLGMHQESLSRSLRRLDELGLVGKSHLGYKLSRKGELFAKGAVQARSAYTPLLQTYIPSNIDVSSIVNSLAGKWFKNLRWLGMVEGEMGHMLYRPTQFRDPVKLIDH